MVFFLIELAMRFIHTSDWHLGRIFHGTYLTGDQSYILADLISAIKEYKPDALIVAGDIYDRSVPPPEAVALLDDTLSQILIETKTPIIMIAGNHDSPERINFGSKILSKQGLHIVGNFISKTSEFRLKDSHDEVIFYAVPFAEPTLIKEKTGHGEINSFHAAMKVVTDEIRSKHPQDKRSVLISHAFVSGGEESESERPLTVGGTGSIDPSIFSGFNYVALGHLHRPQQAGAKHIQYSGSLLKYSFSEANHKKCINLIELDEKGDITIEAIHLRFKKDLRCLSGYLDELLQRPIMEAKDDYIMVTLLDKTPVLDAIGKLRQIYPNVMQIERKSLFEPSTINAQRIDHQRSDSKELFQSFFKEVTANLLDKQEELAYEMVVNDMLKAEREA